jgi:outer membrane immunogenic protein
MKRLATAIAAAIGLIGTPVFAADLNRPVYKTPSPPPAPVYTWTGWYVGGNIGYSWGHGDASFGNPVFPSFLLPATFSGTERLDGVIGGGQIGYNWQPNTTWILGFEADFQGSAEKGSIGFSDPYCSDCDFPTPTGTISGTLTNRIDWFGTVRGRLGWLASPTILLYATGGLAYGRIEASGSITDSFGPFTYSFSNSATNVGWTVGAGIEGIVPNTTNWTWKVEYLYVDLGTVSGSAHDPDFGGIDSWSTKVTDNILRVGLNYQFH